MILVDIIQYIYTYSQLQNPLNRVVRGESLGKNFGLEYDREKNKEGAETVLGIFGFDRTLFGKSKDKR